MSVYVLCKRQVLALKWELLRWHSWRNLNDLAPEKKATVYPFLKRGRTVLYCDPSSKRWFPNLHVREMSCPSERRVVASVGRRLRTVFRGTFCGMIKWRNARKLERSEFEIAAFRSPPPTIASITRSVGLPWSLIRRKKKPLHVMYLDVLIKKAETGGWGGGVWFGMLSGQQGMSFTTAGGFFVFFFSLSLNIQKYHLKTTKVKFV